MAHIANTRDAPRPQVPALHHACIQLRLAIRIQARADAGVQERFVLHVADGRDNGGQRTLADLGPPHLQGAVDGGLAARPLGGGNGARASVDYERGRGQGATSGRLESAAVRHAALVRSPVGDERDAPADRGALRRSPLSEPPVGVRTPNRRSPLFATRNLIFVGHRCHPPSLVSRHSML